MATETLETVFLAVPSGDEVYSLDAIADRGHALDREDWMPGLNRVAIFWHDDVEIRAGYDLAGPSSRPTAMRPNQTAKNVAANHLGKGVRWDK